MELKIILKMYCSWRSELFLERYSGINIGKIKIKRRKK